MYLKNGDTLVTDDLSSLPMKHIEIGSQIVLLNDAQPKLLVLANSHSKVLFPFEGVLQYANKATDYNEDDEEIIIEAYSEHENIKEHYILFPNDDMYKLPKDAYFTDEQEFDESLEEVAEKIEKETHQYIFPIIKDKNDNIISFVSFKMSENTKLVFLLHNYFNFDSKSWRASKEVLLFTKDRYHKIYYPDFELLYKFTVENCDDYRYSKRILEEFETLLELINTDIVKFARKDFLERNLFVSNLARYFTYNFSSHEIETLFKPEFAHGKVEIFKDYESYHNNYIIMYDRKRYLASYAYDSEMDKECRIAESLYLFKKHESAIEPTTGLLYKNGILEHQTMKNARAYFKYDFGIALKINKSHSVRQEYEYFIKLDGYYVKANKYRDSDKEIINNIDLHIKERLEAIAVADELERSL